MRVLRKVLPHPSPFTNPPFSGLHWIPAPRRQAQLPPPACLPPATLTHICWLSVCPAFPAILPLPPLPPATPSHHFCRLVFRPTVRDFDHYALIPLISASCAHSLPPSSLPALPCPAVVVNGGSSFSPIPTIYIPFCSH